MLKNESAEIILSKSGLSTESIVNSIRGYMESATEIQRLNGMNWYADTQNEAAHMASVTGLNLIQCAALLAHTSPKALWSKNRDAAWNIATEAPEFDCDTSELISGVMWGNQRRAIKSLMVEDTLSTFGGPKTRAFCLNISGDMSEVTLDIWMARAIGIEQKLLDRKGLYGAIADVFRMVAADYGIAPAQLQAIVWVVIASKKDNKS
jgi:hypothetical protein